MKTYLATKNAGKLGEIRNMLAGSPIDLHTYDGYIDPVEGDDSYVANALLKARALREQLQLAGIHDAVLADDSGIELDALDGGPGVLSARYAGETTPWPQRLETMMSEVRHVPEDRRGARFICVMALITPDGREIVVEGDVRGQITTELRGTNGFGYDPIFYYPPIGKTFGEIPEAEKNELSHRGRAARALLEALAA
ncbi:MAG: RdgB/HAM1 family non-canonical purine NTP pyrophosphatase [Candidatus Eremiobacteraeota bacterium]|nr:RdgB/HAM1 family non-canonical purine NTP pyrophosphatase [Candidatus Eremiobacteraeota bacterium]